ncbi:MAG: hypothetical protein KDA78_02445 [Planctomycetaceae bacterium]|nr:hypothetical protein [Planctomycetaceae bacterium]
MPIRPDFESKAWLQMSGSNPGLVTHPWILTNPQRFPEPEPNPAESAPQTSDPTVISPVQQAVAESDVITTEVDQAIYEKDASQKADELIPASGIEDSCIACSEADSCGTVRELCHDSLGDFSSGLHSSQALKAQRDAPLLWRAVPDRWLGEALRQHFANTLLYESTPDQTGHMQPLSICGPFVSDEVPAGEPGPRWKNDAPLAAVRLRVEPLPGAVPPGFDEQPFYTGVHHCQGISRCWPGQDKHWNAPNTTHAPLYFEEPNLERHGYTRGGWQPFVSGVQFFTTAPLLPGLMTIDPPTSVQYELSESRPGSWTPYAPRVPEWTYKAVIVELTTVTGLAFLIP